MIEKAVTPEFFKPLKNKSLHTQSPIFILIFLLIFGFSAAQQQKRKGKAFGTKSNINSGKAEDEKATKNYNNKEPRPEALKGAQENTGGYIQTNEAQYTVTAPEKLRDNKEKRKKKSRNQNKVTDKETNVKKYNIKGARPEIKKSVNKDAVPIKKGSNADRQGTFEGKGQPHEKISATQYGEAITHPVEIKSEGSNSEQSTHQGNLKQREKISATQYGEAITHPVEIKSEGSNSEQSTHQGNLKQREKISATQYGDAITHPVPIKSQGGGGEETTHKGNVIQTDKGQGNEFDNSLVFPVKPRHTKASYGKKSMEMSNNTGDIPSYGYARYSDIHSTVPEHLSKIDNSKAIRIQKSIEAASSQGDVSADIAFRRSFTESEYGIVNASYEGEINRNVLTQRNAKRKALNHEISINQGDIEGVYEKMKQTEKQKAIQVRDYKGKLDYDILADRNALRKQKSEEMAKNTGDIIGTYADMLNRMRENNKKIINYSGKIDYNVLKEQKSKMIALSKTIKSYRGDITSTSLAAKKNGLRTRSRKATWYEGDMIVTARTRSNHPSAAYSVSKNSKSISAKEKLRKRAIKKARRHRDREDPDYMKKELPRPRYETREYEIWESKTREGDISTMPQKNTDK